MKQIKVLIVEDEPQSAKRLQRFLEELEEEIIIEAVLDSIESTVDWLKHYICDLIFLDIHLADGNSFEIFNHLEVKTPIVFVTAFDQYAIKAFDQNSVAYLLKPFGKDEIEKAITKFKNLYGQQETIIDYERLSKMIQEPSALRKKKFVIKVGQKLKVVPIDTVAYFYSHNKLTFLITLKGDRYPIDEPLSALESQVDQLVFFRLNRKFLINRNSIKEMLYLAASRIKLILQPIPDFETIVPVEKIGKFKRWLAA